MRALSRLVTALPRALDADLMRDQQISLTDYFALTYLAEAHDDRLRMGELADALCMTEGGATRTVKRLEAQGYVDRRRSASDGRGFDVVLTDVGRERLQQAWPSHLASARSRVLDAIDPADIARITEVIRQITPDFKQPSAPPASDRG